MNKILCYICLILILNNACVLRKKAKMNKEYVDITETVSVEKFKTIASVILKEGNRTFYCNRYNNSPHYKVDSFDVYLNPISQFTNWSADKLSNEVSDYNTIVIQDFKADIIYYHIMLHDNSVVLVCDDEKKNKEIVQETFFKNYLPAIEKAFHFNQSNK